MAPSTADICFSISNATTTWRMDIEHNLCTLALSDSSGSTCVTYHPSGEQPVITAGDVINVSGEIQAAFHPAALVKTAVVCRHGPEQPPVDVEIPSLVNGDYDWRHVRVSGFVREVVRSETNNKWMHLAVCDKGCLLHISAPLSGKQPEDFYRLWGCRVSAVGILKPYDQSTKHYQGRIFQCSGLNLFQILTPRPDDCFDCPTIDLLRYRQPSEIAMLGMHRTSGRVIARWRKFHALLKTDSAELVHLDLSTNSLPKVGMCIDAAGYPESGLFNLILSHATWRPRTPSRASPDHPTALGSELSALGLATLHGKVVTAEGDVARMPNHPRGDDLLVIKKDDEYLGLDVSALTEYPSDLAIGSRVRGTGILLLEPDLRASSFLLPRMSGVSIVLRTTDDLVVLAPPRWWTFRRLFSLVLALLVGLVVLAVWAALLRRLAEKRGRALAAEMIAHAETDLKVLERTRLAVDLHDVIAQNLTGIALELETAKRFSSDSKPELQQHLTIAAQSLRSCRQELRNCLWDLRSHALEEPDMDAAIRHTLPLHLKEVRFVLRFNVPRANFTDNSTHTILCVIRELAHNAVQHGKATLVKIAGCIENGQLLFSVQDNGCGFNPDTCPDGAQGHFGLEGIRERIRPMRGTFTVTSTIGKGVRAVVSIPLRNPTNPS